MGLNNYNILKGLADKVDNMYEQRENFSIKMKSRKKSQIKNMVTDKILYAFVTRKNTQHISIPSVIKKSTKTLQSYT